MNNDKYDVNIEAHTLLPNASKKRFKKTNNPKADTNVIAELAVNAELKGRFNSNLKKRLESLLSKNAKGVSKTINIEEAGLFLSIFKERCSLDDISIYEVINEMNKYEDEFGGFSKHYETVQDLQVTEKQCEKIGYFPKCVRRNIKSQERLDCGMGKTQAMKDKHQKEKYNLTSDTDDLLSDISNL